MIFEVDIDVNGKTFTIEVEAENETMASEFVTGKASTPEGARKIMELAAEGTAKDEDKGFLRQAFEALAVPEALAKEGLTQIAEAIPERIGGGEPTGSVVSDVVRGTPKIVAETLAEVAPSFVSPLSIATTGAFGAVKAAAPALKAVGRAVGKSAERFSGLSARAPGVLQEAAGDPSFLFARSSDSARKLFETLVDQTKIRKVFKTELSRKKFVEEARKLTRTGLTPEESRALQRGLDKGVVTAKEAIDAINRTRLTPEEALVARRALDQARKSIPENTFFQLRKAFDARAKDISKEADVAFRRGKRVEAARAVLPLTKTGEPAFFRAGVLGMMGRGLVPLASPIVQTSAATATGALARQLEALTAAPLRTGTGLGALLREAQKRNGRSRR